MYINKRATEGRSENYRLLSLGFSDCIRDLNSEMMIPAAITSTPETMASSFNSKINSPQESSPSRGIRGIFPILMGILNGLCKFGCLYLRAIADRFTAANVRNVPKTVISATNSMLPISTKAEERVAPMRMASSGVPLLETLERL